VARALVSDEEIWTLCQKGYGPGRAWALRQAEERGLLKDFSVSSPLSSGFVPFDLSGPPGAGRKPRKKGNAKGKVTKASVNYRSATDQRTCGNCSMIRVNPPDFESHSCTLVKGSINPSYTCDRWDAKDKASSADTLAAANRVIAAGLAVRSEDTGRVLLLQRALDPDDPYAGAFEFGGGHLEAGETPFDAACREWSEEVGCAVPKGQVVSMWESGNGQYQGFVLSIPREDAVDINLDYPRVDNPDAPLHAKPETAVWLPIDDLTQLPALRRELLADLPRVLPALRAPVRSASKNADDPRLMGSSISEKKVMDYLLENYPDADLGWVSRCLWAKDNVLLDDINWENRPGGIDEDKVDDMAERLRGGWMPHPCVLVAPSADDKLEVADGYHRCAANAQDKIGVIRAWVGTPKPGNTGWQADVRAMQFTVENHPGDQ
jgi:8-oxo-dGTP pyrophosphatase MutT (NUDIX family)